MDCSLIRSSQSRPTLTINGMLSFVMFSLNPHMDDGTNCEKREKLYCPFLFDLCRNLARYTWVDYRAKTTGKTMDMTGNFIALMISQSDYRSGEKYSREERAICLSQIGNINLHYCPSACWYLVCCPRCDQILTQPVPVEMNQSPTSHAQFPDE